ncbi:MAG: hypothetical protein KatS3mg105_2384 [Gemmatales bacterium]|nr:MAG: hypothetical protein KatS3mg105_2384 [Gemmatales bacterium]
MLRGLLVIQVVAAGLLTCWIWKSAAAHDDFPKIVDTQNRKDVPPTPKEAVKLITVPKGFRVTLFAGEPDVRQPIAMSFDDRGRLWVAELLYLCR